MKNSEKFKTADERESAFTAYCQELRCGQPDHTCTIPTWRCALRWLDLEAEAEKPLPCPFCGGTDVVIQDVGGFELACQMCGFHTPSYMDAKKLISEYQRVARAVMEAGKKDEK